MLRIMKISHGMLAQPSVKGSDGEVMFSCNLVMTMSQTGAGKGARDWGPVCKTPNNQ